MVLDLAQRNEINLIISFKVKNFLYKYLCRNFSDEYIDIKFHVSIFLLSYLLQTKTPPKTKSWLRPWYHQFIILSTKLSCRSFSSFLNIYDLWT